MNDALWVERARASAVAVRNAPPGVHVAMLPPHASLRRYARVEIEGRSEIVMMMPPRDAAPDEAGGVVAASLRDDPFVVVQRWLHEIGVRVPSLYAVDEAGDALWLEDVGTVDLDAAVAAEPASTLHLYRAALRALSGFQDAAKNPPALVAQRHFDAALLRWEVDHYLEWRVDAWLPVQPSSASREALRKELYALADAIAVMPTGPMHRDFQSHNLMVPHDDEIVVLDFQDAMVGPLVYDAVALLRDSYVDLPPAVLRTLVAEYADATARATGCAAADVERWFHMQTVQRKLKDAARFVFIDRVKGNASFLKYIDTSVRYVGAALHALGDEWTALRACLAEVDPQATR